MHGGMVALMSGPMNAFDEALGFNRNQLEAASSSILEAGLEGHALLEQVAMVRQRLELEQDRLAAGAATVMSTVIPVGRAWFADLFAPPPHSHVALQSTCLQRHQNGCKCHADIWPD